MRLSGRVKAQRAVVRLKSAMRASRGIEGVMRRAREIASLPSKVWRGQRVWRLQCVGTSGRGPHEMYVTAAVLWSLIDLRRFRCPYHAHDLGPM